MKAKSYKLKYTPTEGQLIKEFSAIDSVKVVYCSYNNDDLKEGAD